VFEIKVYVPTTEEFLYANPNDPDPPVVLLNMMVNGAFSQNGIAFSLSQ
jgi:hypothetical protein